MINAYGRDVSIDEALLKVVELGNKNRGSKFLGDYLRAEKGVVFDALEFLGLCESEFDDHKVWNSEVFKELESFCLELFAEIDCLLGVG